MTDPEGRAYSAALVFLVALALGLALVLPARGGSTEVRSGDRLSYDAIAARLNADGVPTRTGKAWAGATVCGIVKRGGLTARV